METESNDIIARIEEILGQHSNRLINRDSRNPSANGRKCEDAILALVAAALEAEGGIDDSH